MGHENSYQIAIKSLFWPKCWIASYNTQEANRLTIISVDERHPKVRDESV
jgi:hypothetical protein